MSRINVMNRARFIRSSSRMILMLDFSKLDVETGHQVIRYATKLIGSMPERSFYTLTDVTDASFDDGLKESLKEFVRGNSPHVIAGAVVGVAGLRKVVFRAVTTVSGRTNLKLFDTTDQAREWLEAVQ